MLYAVNTVGAVIGTVCAAFWLLPTLGLRATIVAAAGVNALVFLTAWALARRASPLEPAPEAASRGGRPRRRPRALDPAADPRVGLRLVHLRSDVGAPARAPGGQRHAGLRDDARELPRRHRDRLGGRFAARHDRAPRRARIRRGPARDRRPVDRGLRRRESDSERSPTRPGDSQAVERHRRLHGHALPRGAVHRRDVPVRGPGARARARRRRSRERARVLREYRRIDRGLGVRGLLPGAGARLRGHARHRRGDQPRAGAGVGAAVRAATPAARRSRGRRRRRAGAVPSLHAVGDAARDVARLGSERWGGSTYLGVGRSSTVLVTEQRFAWGLRNNGLPEAGMPRSRTRRQPGPGRCAGSPRCRCSRGPRRARCCWSGSAAAMAIEVVPDSIERIDVIELEPKVLAANQLVAKGRWRDPLSDPRVHVHLNDARNALLLASGRFDAIVSQPSHPWAGGAAHLYTHEFFQLVSSRLAPGGVFVQWIGLPFVDEELFRSLLASLRGRVPARAGVRAPALGLGVVPRFERAVRHGAEHPARARRDARAVRDDRDRRSGGRDERACCSTRTGSASSRAAPRSIATATTGCRAARGACATRTRSSRRIDELIAPVDPLVRALPDGTDVFCLAAPPACDAREARGGVAARSARSRGRRGARRDRNRASGSVRGASSRKRSLAIRATSRAARRCYASRQARSRAAPIPRRSCPRRSPTRSARSPRAGWPARAIRAERPLRALDAQLAAIPLRHPLGVDAVRLRVQARLASGDPALVEEAVEIAEESLGDRPDPSSLLLRAEASCGRRGSPSPCSRRSPS